LWEKRSQDYAIQYIICHCIDAEKIDDVISTFTTFSVLPGYGVSAHYAIEPDGMVYSLVDTCHVAYHAGSSNFGDHDSWDHKDNRKGAAAGARTLNYISIGIELLCPGYAKGGSDWFHFKEYTSAQTTSMCNLIRQLIEKYNISPENVIGHSDCSPYRACSTSSENEHNWSVGKTDPGPLFPWGTLYNDYNIGLPILPYDQSENRSHESFTIFDNTQNQSLLKIGEQLQLIGYPLQDVTDRQQLILTLLAFQQHFVSVRFRCDPSYPNVVLEKFDLSFVLDDATIMALESLSKYLSHKKQ
jgi:N-acetyl-anhydromuramyl-L-alanine amidase AmpD